MSDDSTQPRDQWTWPAPEGAPLATEEDRVATYDDWSAADDRWPAPVPSGNNGYAIASLVCGVLSVVTCLVLGVVAIALGVVAKRKIRESGGRDRGNGLATAGIALGTVSVVVSVIATAALAIVFSTMAGDPSMNSYEESDDWWTTLSVPPETQPTLVPLQPVPLGETQHTGAGNSIIVYALEFPPDDPAVQGTLTTIDVEICATNAPMRVSISQFSLDVPIQGPTTRDVAREPALPVPAYNSEVDADNIDQGTCVRGWITFTTSAYAHAATTVIFKSPYEPGGSNPLIWER